MVMFQNIRQYGRVRQLNVPNCLCTLSIILLWAAAASRGQPRIVGGMEALIHEFPFQVMLISNVTGQPEGICGGSLINKNWVLTAAHCISSENGYVTPDWKLTVRLGAHYRHSKVNGEITARVEITYPHPYYSPVSYVNDIALIKLKSSVSLKKGVIWPISLPQIGDKLRDGTHATMAGWGATKAYVGDGKKSFFACGKTFPPAPNKKYIKEEIRGCGNVEYNNKVFFLYPNALQRTTVSTVGQEKCDHDHRNFICAVSKTSIGCIGDSGSALAHPGKSPGSWVIYGVTSHGSLYCLPGDEGLYTKVTANLDWIRIYTNDTY